MGKYVMLPACFLDPGYLTVTNLHVIKRHASRGFIGKVPVAVASWH